VSQAGFRGDLDPRMICPGERRFSRDVISEQGVIIEQEVPAGAA